MGDERVESPIFILGCHKSRTSLLRALFDGHDDLFVVPFETHFFQRTGHVIDYAFRKSAARRLSVEEASSLERGNFSEQN